VSTTNPTPHFTLADQDTIVAVSTPPGTGGVGMVRVSGPDAVRVGGAVFRCHPAIGERVRHVEFGHILDANGTPLDSGLGWFLKGPASYTGEDTIEITAHGNDLILEGLLKSAVANGAVVARRGEFTRRAFLNGRLDLIQAESVVDLIQAGGRLDLESSYGRASGRLSRIVHEMKDGIVAALAAIEAGLDFADEGDVDPCQSATVATKLLEIAERARRLTDTFEGTRQRHQGYLVALVGRPNVGKSTLLNGLLGEERAIVTAVPGTTRDLVEGRAVWSGEVIRLVDTAGLRSGGGPIEREGMRRTRELLAEADFVVAVLDGSRPWEREDEMIVDLLKTRRGVAAVSKQDLGVRMDLRELARRGARVVHVSGLAETGLTELMDDISTHLNRPDLVEGIGLLRRRHYDLMCLVEERSREAAGLLAEGSSLPECSAPGLQESLGALGELLGEGIEDAVLDHIFSEFCIGK